MPVTEQGLTAPFTREDVDQFLPEELEGDARKNAGDQLHAAALQNLTWRDSLPPLDQVKLEGVPVLTFAHAKVTDVSPSANVIKEGDTPDAPAPAKEPALDTSPGPGPDDQSARIAELEDQLREALDALEAARQPASAPSPGSTPQAGGGV